MTWFQSLFSPKTDWIQIEVSTHCNSACIYCPGTVYKAELSRQYMTMDTFRNLLPALKKTQLAYLQGWGEPFLHPEILTMLEMAKESGCKVGTTTNGMELSDEQLSRIVELGIDVIAFSMAGTNESNDSIRSGTCLDRILDTVKRINEEKKLRGTLYPSIHIAYMLLRSGLDEISQLPAILSGLGVNQAVITGLAYVPAKELEHESLLSLSESERERVKALLDAVAEEGRKYDLAVHYYLNDPGHDNSACTENVQRAMFVSVTGDVSPCVFSSIPVSGAVFCVNGVQRPCQKVTFGNINNQSIHEIWNRKDYKKFRNSFDTGELSSVCLQCPKLNETLF